MSHIILPKNRLYHCFPYSSQFIVAKLYIERLCHDSDAESDVIIMNLPDTFSTHDGYPIRHTKQLHNNYIQLYRNLNLKLILAEVRGLYCLVSPLSRFELGMIGS
jgi:hypothetical protein